MSYIGPYNPLPSEPYHVFTASSYCKDERATGMQKSNPPKTIIPQVFYKANKIFTHKIKCLQSFTRRYRVLRVTPR